MAATGPPTPEAHRVRLPFAPVHHCWSCGTGIEPLQAAGQGGVCDRFECRAEWARRHQEEGRRIEALREAAARTVLGAGGRDPDVVSWSLTPANPAMLVGLTRERREAFFEHLRATMGEAVAEAPRGSPEDGPADEEGSRGHGPPGPDERRALAAGCAACRGWCCRRGGTHAFLDSARIRRLLRERPALTPRDVLDLYASHLGDQHLEGGCVFQGETGCRLPREIRGDLCNRYHCPDLEEARRRWRRSGPGRSHHFVAILRDDGPPPRVVETEVPDL